MEFYAVNWNVDEIKALLRVLMSEEYRIPDNKRAVINVICAFPTRLHVVAELHALAGMRSAMYPSIG